MSDLKSDFAFDPERVCEAMGEALRDSARRLAYEGYLVGISGGVDSAVVAGVICRTIGPASLLGLFLPEMDTDSRSETDARALADAFGFELRKKRISSALKKLGAYDIFWPIYYLPRWIKESIYRKEHVARNPEPGKVFLETRLGTKDKDLRRFNAFHRAKVRMRMLALYMTAELENRLVVGTTNYSELMTGWFAKWGDSLADLSPMAELYKTQVWELAKYLGVPDEIITKRPSPDLVAGMYDEDGLGLSYAQLDLILAGINRGLPAEEIARSGGGSAERAEFVCEAIRRTDHMREMTPFPRLGIGRRIISSSEIGAGSSRPTGACLCLPPTEPSSASSHRSG